MENEQEQPTPPVFNLKDQLRTRWVVPGDVTPEAVYFLKEDVLALLDHVILGIESSELPLKNLKALRTNLGKIGRRE